MNCRTLAVVAFVSLMACACSSVPTSDIEFNTDADPKARFAGYKTYTWVASATVLRDPDKRWSPPDFDAGAEVRFLIDRELRARGMNENPDDPDILVVSAAGVDMEALKLKTDPDHDTTILQNVPQGGLVIVFIDADTRYVMWAGIATSRILADPDEKTVKARLEYAVKGLLKELPK